MAGLKGKQPLVIEISEVPDISNKGATDLSDVEYLLRHDKNTSRPLTGDDFYDGGDFRSYECVELLKQSDIVITNPPFSLFREFVAQLVEHKKHFLIVGNKNAITYKEIFRLIKDDKLWIGTMPMSRDMLFSVPDDYAERMLSEGKQGSQYRLINGEVLGRSPSIWFTNMDNAKRHEEIPLYKHYTHSEYPSYDNYNAIDVSRVAEIPVDYYEPMGVPITFFDKYNPEQFEILGITKTWFGGANKTYPNQEQVSKNGQKSIVTKLNDGATLKLEKPPVNQTYYIVNDEIFIQLYARVIIKRK